MAAVSPEAIGLSTLQTQVESLWEQGGLEPTELTLQQATMFSEWATSILNSTLSNQGSLERLYGSWPIPNIDSFVRHKQLTKMVPADTGRGYRTSEVGSEIQVDHHWRPESGDASWSAVITNSRLNDGQSGIKVEIEKPGLPSRSFSYTFIEQS